MTPYYKQVLFYLKDFGQISSRQIQLITTTTCPHKVIQQLKTKGFLDKEDIIRPRDSKWYKVHYISKDFNKLYKREQ